jgi:hypothetical protein
LNSERLGGPLLFGADGRYLSGVNERDGYRASVADTLTGEVFIPQYGDAYPWIGWGYGDTLMLIQGHEGTNDGKPERQEPTPGLRRQRTDVPTTRPQRRPDPAQWLTECSPPADPTPAHTTTRAPAHRRIIMESQTALRTAGVWLNPCSRTLSSMPRRTAST